MKIKFVSMTESSYQSWKAANTPEFVADRMITDYETEEEAQATVEKQFATRLPRGLDTPHHHFFDVVELSTNENVGQIWLRIDNETKVAFLLHIVILKPHRRKGYGKAAMHLVATTSKQLGAKVLWLNVMGHNPAAQRLYQSVGMKTAALHMNQLL